ncbi:myelin-associated glycoprotein-like [Ptychodera flava]|uniref:myelin-associated glycoprotein-like n=1 Tax=Ptychodera flava TaxID=63121 RepID=UPI003969E282
MNVQYPPDINITDENGSILTETTIEGASYSARCNVDANPTDNLNLKWEFQDNTIYNGALLELQQVNRDQAGIYNCVAENMFYDGTKGYGSQSIDIDVQFPPSVEVMLSDAVAKEGTSLTLACNVIDSNPVDVDFSWILADGTEYDEAVVDIVAVTRELNGNQSCSATNTFYDGSHGMGMNIIHLDVQYIATINMSVQPSNEVMKSSFVRITCTVLDGNPNPYKLKLTLTAMKLLKLRDLSLYMKYMVLKQAPLVTTCVRQ